ncbi:hypothetical protein TRVA0_069S00386 [Trichomonascus vanleenenianus]|uniref:HbrB domain-containing protein n=1 Tax=Trichomonascus vanleenenianus TaxID=2268995 RepID=UPI003EC9D696
MGVHGDDPPASAQFEGTRMRAFSHTRTNSSSSSNSSHVSSPTATSDSASLITNPAIPPIVPLRHIYNTPGSVGSESDVSSNASSHKLQYQHTASEAAAVAAVRNTVNNVQITARSHDDIHNLGVGVGHTHTGGTSNTGYSSTSHHGFYSHLSHSNKFSSVAASAAALAAKPKESALSKAKLFARTAKPHLSSSTNQGLSHSKRKGVDLTVQTKQLPPGRPSLSERSPLARPSKELERIASIGTMPVLGPGSATTRDDRHKHHISFRSRKDAHSGVMLSSSSSNSKLISDASIYSFHPSSPGMASIDVKNINTKEDREQLAEETWSLLRSRVMPLFTGEGLRIPVEDLNNLVLMRVSFMMQQGSTAKDVVSEFKGFLQNGMRNIDPTLVKSSDDKLISKLVNAWMRLFTKITPYLEAIFLPLQNEFEGTGQLLNSQEAKEYWSVLLEKDGRLNTRRYILMAFRDTMVIPVIDRLEHLISQSQLNFEGTTMTETVHRILQCTNILALIQSGDDKQQMVEHLVKTLRKYWLSMPRTGKDRRGFVLSKE